MRCFTLKNTSWNLFGFKYNTWFNLYPSIKQIPYASEINTIQCNWNTMCFRCTKVLPWTATVTISSVVRPFILYEWNRLSWFCWAMVILCVWKASFVVAQQNARCHIGFWNVFFWRTFNPHRSPIMQNLHRSHFTSTATKTDTYQCVAWNCWTTDSWCSWGWPSWPEQSLPGPPGAAISLCQTARPSIKTKHADGDTLVKDKTREHAPQFFWHLAQRWPPKSPSCTSSRWHRRSRLMLPCKCCRWSWFWWCNGTEVHPAANRRTRKGSKLRNQLYPNRDTNYLAAAARLDWHS